jgi:hypothetical protein
MSALALYSRNFRETGTKLRASREESPSISAGSWRTQGSFAPPAHRFSHHRACITELDATRQISQAGSATTELREGVETLVGIALQTLGIVRIELIPSEPLISQIPSPLSFGLAASTEPSGVAFADVAADGKRWGELRVFFELRPLRIENPLRFAKYLGQQLGAFLVRMELVLQRDALKRKAARFRTLVAKRKAIHRAKALLRHAHNISENEALVLMRRYVEQTGRTMHQIAEAIVFRDRQKWNQGREVPLAGGDDAGYRRRLARKRG